jgi:F-type H+-transporting ATPase subunit b
MKTLALILLLAGEEHKGSLLDIDPGLIVWTLITFSLLLFLLSKLAWKPIIKTLQEREEKIRHSLEEAEKARREAEALIARNADMMAQAERDAQELVRRAKEMADKLKLELTEQGKLEAAKMLTTAKKEIENEKNAALSQLKSEVADMVVQAAGKVIGSALDADKHKKIVDDFIKEMPSRN